MFVFFTEVNVEWTGTYYAVPRQEYATRIHTATDRNFSIVDSEVSDTFQEAVKNYLNGMETTTVTDTLKIKVDKSPSALADFKITTLLR